MMKACKNNVHFIHLFEWSMGTFDGVQDLIGEKASTDKTTVMVIFKTWGNYDRRPTVGRQVFRGALLHNYKSL